MIENFINITHLFIYLVISMKKYNILLLNALNIYGGGEFFVYQFAGLLKQRGHNPWVSCREDNLIFDKCVKDGIPVFPLNYPVKGKGKLIRNIRALKRFIIENQIDLVHSNTNYDRTAGAFAARLAHKAHVTTNHSFHSIEYNPTHWLRNKYLTSQFIVDGECTRKLLLADNTIDDKKITLIHLGIEADSMKRDDDMRMKIRNDFGLKENNILIGNVGRMVEFKGQEYLIKAFPAVFKDHPDARLMVVGSGKLENILKELSDKLGVKEKIIFPGFRDDMQAVYSAFDIYAHTSVEGGGETFPYAVLYALAQALPLVVTKVGDVPAMVEEGVNGFVVNDRNPSLITDKIKVLLQDKELRKKMGDASLELLKSKFTVEIMTDSILQVYEKALRNHN
jgi:glycosyltransferase involved in cell wall biosynthesis